ncbi:MAG: PrsW family intramembrane metalloprotease, partial [Candidatus Micrarchaeia archaeon]
NISIENVPLVLIIVFGSMIISPVSEEVLKAIGVYIMGCHRQTENMLDGLLYGFAVGVGFAAVENWFYFVSKMNPLSIGVEAWLLSILYRSIFNTIAHGCFTAFIGAFIGIIKARPRMEGYHYLGLLPGLFVAIILHMIFNLSAFLDIVAVETFKTAVLFFNPLLVVTVGIGFVILYYFGLVESRKTPMG